MELLGLLDEYEKQHASQQQHASTGHADPAAPCPSCAGGYYWRSGPEMHWFCHTCRPPEGTPWATRTVPGGHLPSRPTQNVATVLKEARAGLPISVEILREHLADEDLSGIATGHILVPTVRAFAQHLIQHQLWLG